MCAFQPMKSKWVGGKWEAKGVLENPCGLKGYPLRVLGLTYDKQSHSFEEQNEEVMGNILLVEMAKSCFRNMASPENLASFSLLLGNFSLLAFELCVW